MQVVWDILAATWRVIGDMAPYLLLGFAIAGLLAVYLSPAFVVQHLGGRGFRPVLKAALLGVPMPLCSCGVLPVGAALRQQGASRGATLSFLITTPQTGVESIAAVQGMLGPIFAGFIVATTFVSGLIGGAVQTLLDRRRTREVAAEPVPPAPPAATEARRTLRAGLRYGLVTLPRDMGRPMLLGFVLAGLLTALLPPGYLAERVGQGMVAMLIMLVIGIPLYVCSAGSIPLAYAFLSLGISPGAVLVFLVAGPATNTTAMTTIYKLLGRGAFAVYLASIVACSLAAGLLMNRLAVAVPLVAPAHVHADGGRWLQSVCAVVLLAMLAPGVVPEWFARRRGAATPQS